MLLATCYLLLATCYLLDASCCLLFASCCLLLATCFMLLGAVCCLLLATCFIHPPDTYRRTTRSISYGRLEFQCPNIRIIITTNKSERVKMFVLLLSVLPSPPSPQIQCGGPQPCLPPICQGGLAVSVVSATNVSGKYLKGWRELSKSRTIL